MSTLLALVVRTTKVVRASGFLIDRSVTVSVMTFPSAVAAIIASPSLRASTVVVVEPSARVTMAVDGKQGSSENSGENGGGENGGENGGGRNGGAGGKDGGGDGGDGGDGAS